MDFKEAINKIFDGDCILFLGSGFSLGAKNTYPVNNDIKKANELAYLLYDKCGFAKPNGDLGKAANLFLRKHGAPELIDILKKEFTISTISPEQEYLGNFNWFRIYTTNYDEIIERAYSLSKKAKHLTPLTLSDYPNDYNDKSKIALHLNGYINNLTKETLDSKFKLTNRSYLVDDFRTSEWIELFRDDLKVADAIFFIGFSLDYDLDIARIINEGDIKNKAYFIIWDEEDEINIETLKDFGSVQPINLEGFVKTIKEQQKMFKPVPIKLFNPLCFSTPELKKNLPVKRDIDFYDLLLKGLLNDHLLYHSIINPGKIDYFIYRDKLNEVIDSIKDGNQTILIDSNLGNGKTLFLRALSIILTQNDTKVFYFERYFASIERELKQICEGYENAVVIFDDYQNAKDHIRFFCGKRTNQVLITSERTQIFETIFEAIEEVVGKYVNFNINKLSDKELDILDRYLADHSLWKEWSSRTKERRIAFMKDACKSQICDIIISRLETTELGDRIKKLVNNLQKREGYYNALITILLSKTLKFDLELSDISGLLNDVTLNNPAFRRNSDVNEFISFEENKITFKSPILAQFILSNLLKADLVIDTMILLAESLDTKYSTHYPSRKKLQSLMNFRTIQKSINMRDVKWKSEIFRYYETIKDLNFCANNIHFWLQYAIARLSDYNYPIAEAYFQKCYSIAEDIKTYDTYKIDNHYCRFLLENEIENGNESTCMDAFDHAHKILITPHKGEELKHYPYRVAGNYYKFYKVFFNKLERHQQKKFLAATEDMYKKLSNYLNNKSAKPERYVFKTKEGLETILNENIFKADAF